MTLSMFGASGEVWLRRFVLLELLIVFTAGSALLLSPDLGLGEWAWATPPFNSRFLGAVYLTTAMPLAIQFFARSERPTRIVVWAVMTFTTVLLIASLLYIGSFEYDRVTAWIWWILYIILPVANAWYVWKRGVAPPASATVRHPAWRAVLSVSAALSLAYGLALFAAPGIATEFWPWLIDDFHGRLYSGVFVAGAVVVTLLVLGATAIERMTVAGIQISLGVLSIAGLLINDAKLNRVDWERTGTWVWMGLFALIAVSGVALLLDAMAQSRVNHRRVDGHAGEFSAESDAIGVR